MNIRHFKLHQCPICASTNIDILLHGYDFESKTGSYTINHCRSCYINFTNPQPVAEDIHYLYEKRDSAEFTKGSPLVEKLRKYSYKLSLKKLFSYLIKKDITAVDYGCGDGLFAVVVADNCEVTAVDFHKDFPLYIEKAKLEGKKIHYQDNITFQENKTTYDLIILRQVLEHTTNPDEFLLMIKNKMNKGGIILIEVPNFNSVWRHIFKKYWSGLYLPRHLFHFEPTTLKDLINKNFHIHETKQIHSPQLGLSLGYLTNTSLGNLSILGLAFFPLQILVDSLFRTSGNLSVIATKEKVNE